MASFRPCTICKILFQFDGKKSGKRYCSNACKQRAYRIAKSPARNKPREIIRIDDFCLWCKREMLAVPGQKYCSAACKQACYRYRARGGKLVSE